MIEHLFERSDGLDLARGGIAAASLVLALAYLPFVAAPPSPARAVAKTAAIGVLTMLPFTYFGIGGAHAFTLVVLAAALALSALGDMFLALKDQRRFFLFGLASFLGAHVAYLAAFLPRAEPPGAWALAAVAAALAAAGALMVVLLPRLGKLKWPVVAYFTVIMAMVASALSIPGASPFLGAGAVLFALSDSLIAVRKFLRPFPGIGAAVWVTYCAAQFMIAAALLALAVPAETL